MAQTIPTPIAPDRFTGPRQSDGAAREQTVTPFPIGETPGRPFIRPHRLAKTVRDDESYNRLRAGHRDYARIEQLIAQDMRPRANVFATLLCLSPAIIAVAYFGWQFAR